MGRETIYGEDGKVEPNSGIAKGTPFVGVEEYSVGQWYATPDGSGKPQAVQLNMDGIFVTPDGQHAQATIYMRLKSSQAVDELCRALLRSRKRVWPNEPINVY
jgi:hypothetical protein